MAKPYLIQRGDTLRKIAKANYGDASLAASIADYNGLPDPGQIFAGQTLMLPTTRELATASALPAPGLPGCPAPPCGFNAICSTFGDLLASVGDDGHIDPSWEATQMVRAAIPFPIPLSWNTAQQAKSILCHKLIQPVVEDVFRRIDAGGLRGAVKTYGGCYAYRPKRNGTKPSTHSWGIATDLNPNTNAMGSAGDMDPSLVEVFEQAGFTWGGRWTGRSKDPMHFQYCSGY